MQLPPVTSSTSVVSQPLSLDKPVRLAALAQELVNVKAEALVQRVIALTEEQQQSLSQQLAALARQSGEIQKRPGESLQLLTPTKLAQLQIPTQGNTLPARLLAIVQEGLLQPGDRISVQVTANGQLSLLTPSGPEAKDNPGPQQQPATQTLKAALRQYLPYEKPNAQLAKLEYQFTRQLTALPRATRLDLLSPSQWQSVVKLQQPVLPVSPSATDVRQQLSTSGQFFENRLASAVTSSGTKSFPADPAAAGTRPTVTPLPGDVAAVDDHKGTLLALLANTGTTASTAAGSQPASLQGALTQAASQLRHADALLASLAQVASAGHTASGQGELKERLQQLLQALAATGIARITAQQLRQLMAPPDSGVILDTQLRFHDSVIPLHVHIQPVRSYEEEEPSTNKKGSKKKRELTRRWRIFMEFDLDRQGWFATELDVFDQTIKTRLWSEQDSIRQRAQSRLQRLEDVFTASGLVLDTVTVESGEPQRPKQTIAHSLVDIRT